MVLVNDQFSKFREFHMVIYDKIEIRNFNKAIPIKKLLNVICSNKTFRSSIYSLKKHYRTAVIVTVNEVSFSFDKLFFICR